MSNFWGKIIVYNKKGVYKVRVVTLLDSGDECVDFCTLDEIEQAIKSAQQAHAPDAASKFFIGKDYATYGES